MILKLKTLVPYLPVRHVGDLSIFPTSVAPLTEPIIGDYPRPPPFSEQYKKPKSKRFVEARPQTSILDCGYYKNLPDSYRKFYIEWKLTSPEPVHYRPEEGKYYKDAETGQILDVQNVPIPLISVPQEDDGLWGGEAIIQGYFRIFKGIRRIHDLGTCPRFWYPKFYKHVIYSEILDKHMTSVMTERTILLINNNFGLDHYLLKTRACDLRNLLAVKLKRKLLHILLDKSSLYPDDEEKREEIYEKYKHYLDKYTPEEIEWYGLSLDEAAKKMKGIRAHEREAPSIALKHQYRKDFIDYLINEKPFEAKPEPWYKKKLISFK